MRRIVGCSLILILLGSCGHHTQAYRGATGFADVSAPDLRAGRDYHVLADLPNELSRHRHAFYLGVTADKQAYGMIVDGSNYDKTTDLDRYGAILTDLKSGHMTFMSTPEAQKKAAIITSMSARDGWVVWVEASDWDQLYVNDWTLYSYQESTGITRELARAPRVHADHVPTAPGGPMPRIIDGRVYLGGVKSFDEVHAAKNVAFSVPVDGSGPLRIDVDPAANVQASAGVVFYTAHNRAQVFDPRTGTSRPLAVPPESKLEGWDAGEGVFAYGAIDKRTKHNRIKIRQASGTTLDTGLLKHEQSHVHTTSRWVGWSGDLTPDGDKQTRYLYDIQRRKVFHLPWTMTDTADGNGPYVIVRKYEHGRFTSALVLQLTR